MQTYKHARRTRLAATFAAALLALASPVSTIAQSPVGAVEGAAASADDAAAIPFALVRLLPAQSPDAPVRQGITNASGRFRFADVPAGEYRLQLARIGFRPVLSPVVRVRAGETVRHDLSGPTQVMQLAAVTVRPDATCLTATQLADDARLAALWGEARKGVEIRRGFKAQYRFMRSLRQDVRMKWNFRRATTRTEVDSMVSEPHSVLARDRRRQALNRDSGYVRKQGPGSFRLRMPDEKELFDDAFLVTHCVETTLAEAEGAHGLRFRPVQTRRDGVDIRGTVWVDAATYQIRRLDVDHLDGTHVLSKTSLDYADVAIGAQALRLPSRGALSFDPSGALSVLLRGGDAKLAYAYWGFAQVRAP